LVGLLLTSTQLPLQTFGVCGGHAQLPFTQALIDPVQGWPQLPQFAGSLLKLAHPVPHVEYGNVHVHEQLPLLHVGVAFTGAPHGPQLAPQCCGSFCVSKQPAVGDVHFFSGAVHAKSHPEAEHEGALFGGVGHVTHAVVQWPVSVSLKQPAGLPPLHAWKVPLHE
jgi:hypothetical protein